MIARQRDPSICQRVQPSESNFEIGIDLFEQLEEIYDKRDRRDLQQTWAKWWKLFFPGNYAIPDGVHQGTISFPSAEIPALQELWKEQWNQEAVKQMLPYLDPPEMHNMLQLFERVIRLWNFTRQRRPRTQGQRQKGSSVHENGITGPQIVDQWLDYPQDEISMWNHQHFNDGYHPPLPNDNIFLET